MATPRPCQFSLSLTHTPNTSDRKIDSIACQPYRSGNTPGNIAHLVCPSGNKTCDTHYSGKNVGNTGNTHCSPQTQNSRAYPCKRHTPGKNSGNDSGKNGND